MRQNAFLSGPWAAYVSLTVNRTLPVCLLEKRGYDVSIAVNGREAVQAVEREEFGVALMDIQMPEMDGFEATGAIREKERGTSPHTPMTAHALKGDEDRCPDRGMDAYFSKPIRSSQLYEIPERMLDALEAKGRAPVAAQEKPLR